MNMFLMFATKFILQFMKTLLSPKHYNIRYIKINPDYIKTVKSSAHW